MTVGWELISMPNKSEYKPYFVVYPLWENSLAKCMNSPLLLMSLKKWCRHVVLTYDIEQKVASKNKKIQQRLPTTEI